MASPEKLIRQHLKKVKAYSSARDEYTGAAEIFLDANENSLGSPAGSLYHRYPDPHHRQLKERWSEIRQVPTDRIFFGNGSDEPIDLMIRLFCEPGRDHIVTLPPTYGMYGVSAAINGVQNMEIPLTPQFQPDIRHIEDQINDSSKLLFLCSPNNPSGNLMKKDLVSELIRLFPGMVIIDQAYIDFTGDTIDQDLSNPKVVVFQTLSKAWGLAGLRIGIAMGDPYVIDMLEKIKPPYNLSQANQDLALKALNQSEAKDRSVGILVEQREWLRKALLTLTCVEEVMPSDANFLLVRFHEAPEVFNFLKEKGVIVRDRSKLMHCAGCLRITVGTPEENRHLMELLQSY